MSPIAGANLAVAIERHAETSLADEAGRAVDAACDFLLNRQDSHGYWVGEVEGDTTLESDYILLQLWLHQPDRDGRWHPPTRARIDAACARILEKQLADGGWSTFQGGQANASASVKAYAALKLSGLPASHPRMEVAAARILALGGIESTNSYTKLYLSYFGLFPRDRVPSIPPEIFLIPAKQRFSVYSMSAWSRAMLAPLSILDATQARRRVPTGLALGELFSGRETPLSERISWKRFFHLLDKGIKFLESTAAGRNRRKGVAAARDWMLERLQGSYGLGAIFPAMVNSIMALTQLGYGLDDPVVKQQLEHFDDLVLDDERGFRVQPCRSPVWDTALTAFAIGAARPDAAGPSRWALGRAADWLLAKQTERYGDWAVRNPSLKPGGWFFEFSNEHYPDTDDTAKVLLALEWARSSDPDRQRRAERRALDWLAGMQSSDGGWAAFDVDNSTAILTQVPFADHNAMLDPTCADITGRVLEALSRRARDRYRENVRKGVDFLIRAQEGDGCWYGRWGVNYLYGTCFAARGLRAAGLHPRHATLVRAGEWVRSVQNADGGWGESAASYDAPPRYAGSRSTPSQTAWALMTLFAADDFESGSVQAGVRYLLDRQTPQGTWEEDDFTGTGFPQVFYLRYHMYPQYFPLIALSEYARGGER